MLIEHRVDDIDERLVGVEDPVPAREEVALEPALALVLAEHFDDAAVGRRRSSVGTTSPSHCLFVTSNTAVRRLEAVSSGPKIRKFPRSALSLMTSRRNLPSVRASSFMMLPG